MHAHYINRIRELHADFGENPTYLEVVNTTLDLGEILRVESAASQESNATKIIQICHSDWAQSPKQCTLRGKF